MAVKSGRGLIRLAWPAGFVHVIVNAHIYRMHEGGVITRYLAERWQL